MLPLGEENAHGVLFLGEKVGPSKVMELRGETVWEEFVV